MLYDDVLETDPKSNYQIQSPGIKVEWHKKNIPHKT